MEYIAKATTCNILVYLLRNAKKSDVLDNWYFDAYIFYCDLLRKDNLIDNKMQNYIFKQAFREISENIKIVQLLLK